MPRCGWAKTDLSIAYHDEEWGVPVHDDRTLFEFLVLEGAQAGLSWETILRKRAAYRVAFDRFEIATVSGYDDRKIQALLLDSGIVRNRLKIAAAIGNARPRSPSSGSAAVSMPTSGRSWTVGRGPTTGARSRMSRPARPRRKP